ncbi:hypothetical protein BV20DRAFT_1033871 [Pilatotrama ljubarskyi]|nr:hypothetical protein BV20DRAFT_1033871 [Pilatotrama ljubarskyi]
MLGHYSMSATLALFLLFLGVVHAAPLASEIRNVHTSLRLARDDENLSQPTTIQTTNTIQTAVGPMLQTCTIKLTPITGDNGEPLVREEKSCSVQMTSSGNNASGSDGSNASSSADAGASSTDSAASASQTDAPASPTATDSNAAASATATGGAVGVNGSSQVPGSALSTGATDSAAATATASSDSAAASATATASSSSGAKAVSPGGFSTIDASAVATESDASATGSPTAPVGNAADNAPTTATSAADTATSSAAASFQLPGTKLSVLPIGLGVFAGISVIALIVVGLVTYERTKYRKAFRQRKLAESGAAMGYGGMA